MKMFDGLDIRSKLLPTKEVRLFLDLDADALLQAVPADARERYHALAQRWVGYAHPPLLASDYMEYSVNWNRCNFENLYINRRTALVELLMATLLEDTDDYMKDLVDTLWLVLTECTWVIPAHGRNTWADGEKRNYYVLPEYDIDGHDLELYSAETGALVALVYHYLKDKLNAISPYLNRRILHALRERIIRPFMEREFGWMGIGGHRVNNWNPWIHSNVLLVSALMELEDELHKDVVERCLTLTENYVRWLPEDAGCDEGARYWNLSIACLVDIAETVYDLTGGQVDVTAHDVLAKAGQYILAVYDRYGHAANFADSSITFWADCSLLVRMGRKTNQPDLVRVGAWLYRTEKLRTIHDNFYRQFKNMLELSLLPAPKEPDFPPVVYMPGLQVFTVHRDDCMFAMKGGTNKENHNHNDIGSFVFYKGEHPVLIDPGVDYYSGHTFNENRYLNWYMQSAYHNTPHINGVQQVADGFAGKRPADMPAPTRAYFAQDARADVENNSFSLELKTAYPDEAAIRTWRRTGQLQNGTLTLTDEWDIGGSGEVVFHLMLCSKPVETKPGEVRLENGALLRFAPTATPAWEEVDLTQTFDTTRKPIWESRLTPRLFKEQWDSDVLYRVNIPVKANQGSFTLTVE